MSTSRKHDWLVDKIYGQPDLVDIPVRDVISKNQEHILLYKGQYLTIPDIVMHTRLNTYMLEIKSADTQTHFSKGMSQLEKIVMWHDFNNLPEPETRLIMPKRNTDKLWIDMLDDLKIYNLGDSYK